MARYLVLWEGDSSKLPVDRKELGAALSALLDGAKQGMKEGTTKDWGKFLGEGRGYSIHEGSEMELEEKLQRFLPFITFKVYQVMSVEQVAEAVKSVKWF